MGLKKGIASLLSVTCMISVFNVNVQAQENDINKAFQITNAPSGAKYSIYTDVSKNYIYDDFEDTFVCSFTCDETGIGYASNLEEGNYVAVLQSDYDDTNIVTDKQYAFTYNGEDNVIQEAYTSTSRFNFNTGKASTNDTVSFLYDVPLFKQSGPSALGWSSLYINGSSDTMGWAGCLICSFAMMRSYEAGYKIYPNQMMNTYSSSTGLGVVYSYAGSSSMVVSSSASNYGWTVYGSVGAYGGNGEIPINQKTNQELLKTLYNKLKFGPVIFGGYSTYNGRTSSNHWIVVNGYSGDGVNFSSEDFLICDPANNNGVNRTTLAQYQQSYPYWDRLIYNPNPSTNGILIGDVTLDGNINSADLLLIKRYVLEICDLNSDALRCADLNSDGKINSTNVLMVKQLVITP